MFFKSKSKDTEPAKPEAKRHKTMQEIVHQRILTAEGRRRQMLKKMKKAK